MVVPLPEPEETPEDGAMPEDDEDDDDDDDDDEPELAEVLVGVGLAGEDLLDDDLAADEDPELAFFGVEEVVPALVFACVAEAAE